MEKIIEVNHLKKYFGETKAVDDISFQVEKGELFGFLGVNGAGKSTTINILCTLFPQTKGEVVVDGMCLGKENEAIRRHIGVVYQNNCLDQLLTVKENLLIRGSLYETDKQKLRENFNRVCTILELSDVVKRPYGKLSGGQKRRCEIACALMHAPEILFLDEPTTGLDPATRKSVWRTIGSLRRELNMTVFLTTHYMEEAARANHIAIMDKGKLIHEGTPFELKEQFARDKLCLIPKQGKYEALTDCLYQMQLSFKQKEEKINVTIPDTMSAIPVIERCQMMIGGFEVIQGTMDDVFLNVTGGEREYA